MKIGIIGLAGAGKDTFAAMLRDELGGDWQITRYAAPLKTAAEYVFGPHFDDRELKEIEVYVDEALHDRMVVAAFGCCHDVGFSDEEFDRACELFFEHFYEGMDCSPRKFQQLLGTDVIRAVREDAFVQRVRNLKGNYIVPDVRFENELLDENVVVVRKAIRAVNPHPSEALASLLTSDRYDADTWEWRTISVVQNYGDLEELRLIAKSHATCIKHGW